MECGELTERAIGRLTGQLAPEEERGLAAHAASCEACRAEIAALEGAWQFLGEDRPLEASPEFRRRSRALLEEEMLRARVREFRPRRRTWRAAGRAAAVVAAAGLGYLAAAYRGSSAPAKTAAAPAVADRTAPGLDLGANPRFSNLSFQKVGSQRVGIGFDVTTRRSIEGSPEDPEVARLLAYLVAHNAENAGEKSRAIELVQQHYASGEASPSPDIVSALANTLKRDPNPGVRKKAADALSGMRMTPEIRTALLDALRDDRNPAVRLAAIDRLAAAAKESPDPRTVQSLREKAVDPSENGFVRAKAASALKAMEF
jgi:hypothetical protein